MREAGDAARLGYPWRPRVLKIRRALLWLTLVPLAVSIFAYLILLVQVCQLTPTGDPLFDHYARAVRNRQAWQLFAGVNGHPAALPDAQLAKWEPQFGNDPRYWELRYFCASAREAPAIAANGFGMIDEVESARAFLEEAISRGVARQSTLAPLLRSKEGDAQLEWMVRVAAAAPDNAYGHYRLGEALFAGGDYPAARKALALGNGAPRNHVPHLFPLEMVWQNASAEQAAGSRFLSGAIIEAGNHVAQDYGVRLWRYDLERVGRGTPRAPRIALEPQWYEAICRIAAAEHIDLWFGAQSALIQEMTTALRTSELNQPQRELATQVLASAHRLAKDDHVYLGSFSSDYSALWVSREWNIVDVLAEIPPPEPERGSRFPLDLLQGYVLYMTPALRFPHESRALIDNCRYSRHQAAKYEELAKLDWSVFEGVVVKAEAPAEVPQ